MPCRPPALLPMSGVVLHKTYVLMFLSRGMREKMFEA